MSISKLRERTRVGILLALLGLICLVAVARLDHLNRTAYAYTISLGDNYGKIFRGPLYYELPPILQESVEVHERQHLLDGTFHHQIEGEIRAYKAQLSDLRLKIQETRILWKKTQDPRYYLDLRFLRMFEKDTEDLLQEYEERLNDRKSKEGH